MINVYICSIKAFKYKLQNEINNYDNIYCIINTSYDNNISFLYDYNFGGIIVEIYDDVKEFSGKSFNETIAIEIKNFVDELPNNVDLYVCCDEGISRSAAIASAIKRYLEQDEMNIWNDPHYHPNIFVYSILCDIFGFNDTDERLNELEQISNSSLSNAINSSRN